MTIKSVLYACIACLVLTQSAPATRGSASSAEEARRAAIRASIAALEKECETHGGGDWSAWYDQLAPFRADVRSRMRPSGASAMPTLLQMEGFPPQFENTADVSHLAEAGSLDEWIGQRDVIGTVATVSRWLRKQNVDVIFVPVPRAADIYPDRLAKHVPADRIVAPQLKKVQLDLLKADVEVIDLLPALLAARETNAEGLTLADDPHWGPAAQDIAARLITERLARYPFAKRAMAQRPLYHTKAVARSISGAGAWEKLLTGDQMQWLGDATQVIGTQILDARNREFQPVDDSPVVLMGDSFSSSMGYLIAPGTSLDAHISKGINLPITLWMVAGNTVQLIKDAVRDPGRLKDRSVIIWLVQESSVSRPKAWTLPALPEPGAGR